MDRLQRTFKSSQTYQATRDGKWSFKASSADTRTKVIVIQNNIHKYSVSAMCKVLQIPRSTYYYEAKEKTKDTTLETTIIKIFKYQDILSHNLSLM